MRPVDAREILALADYALERPAMRQRILEVKAHRRVSVGEHVTLLFENHDTVLYQIQEMLRVERITDPAAIQHEIATYNELVPGQDALSATLLIEYQDPDERDRRLRELVGLDRYLHMEVAECVRTATFDTRQTAAERISSVHYVKFPLGAEAAEAIRQGHRPVVVIDHPSLQARTELTVEQAQALAEDLSA